MKWPFKSSMAKRLYINTNFDLENTLLLAGTGRSGTTWLSNIINHRNEYRYIFEPFVPQYTKEWRAFHYKQYIRPENRDPSYIVAAERILSGRIKNPWVDKYNRKVICNRRLVKDIRINFMLKWIHTTFPQIPIIFMLRHPCAVAHSRMRLNWDLDLVAILEQNELIEDYFADFLATINGTNDSFLKNICLWCIENFVPLNEFKKNEVYILFYEHLCLDPEHEIIRLFEWLEQEHPVSLQSLVKTPSQVTGKHSAIRSGEDLIKHWATHVSKARIIKAARLLGQFGLDTIYDDTPLPLSDRLPLGIQSLGE